jgi:hypothetical protein
VNCALAQVVSGLHHVRVWLDDKIIAIDGAPERLERINDAFGQAEWNAGKGQVGRIGIPLGREPSASRRSRACG